MADDLVAVFTSGRVFVPSTTATIVQRAVEEFTTALFVQALGPRVTIEGVEPGSRSRPIVNGIDDGSDEGTTINGVVALLPSFYDERSAPDVATIVQRLQSVAEGEFAAVITSGASVDLYVRALSASFDRFDAPVVLIRRD